MPFDHEDGQAVRQFLLHHTIRQTERRRMREVKAQAEAHGDAQTCYEDVEAARLT
jgi:hypothetical protein